MRRFLSAVLLAGALTPANAATASAQVEPNPLVVDVDTLSWGEPSYTPRFARGTQTVSLGLDPETRGPTYLARFPAGSHFDLHWHTHAEYVVVIDGEGTLVLGDARHSISPGTYVVIPERAPHSWDVPAGGAPLVILVRRRGPADFHFVDP